MRRLLIPGLFFVSVALSAACANATPTATVVLPPTHDRRPDRDDHADPRAADPDPGLLPDADD